MILLHGFDLIGLNFKKDNAMEQCGEGTTFNLDADL